MLRIELPWESQGAEAPRCHNLDATAGALAVLDKLHDSATDSLAPHWQTSLEQLGDGQECRKHESYMLAYLGNPFGKNFDATREKTCFL